jgi:hypothetical protein
MIVWPIIPEEVRKQRMILPSGKLDMVLDTDTYNEVDDQFALCYSLLSPERLNVEAIYAAPFLNERSRDAKDGMEQSYGEILRLMHTMGRKTEGLVFKGVGRFMQGPEDAIDCPAARDLVKRAMARPEGDPLYVVAIGAVTNIAAALVMEPKITEKIVVIWLGGHALTWPDTREFNLKQDLHAVRTVLDCGVPMILVPCMGVSSHMITTVHELNASIGGKNEMCDALIELVKAYSPDHFGWSKPLWDVAAIGLMLHEKWASYIWEESPLITEDVRWAKGENRPLIRVVEQLDRNAIFHDLFMKLSAVTIDRP